MHQSSVRPLYNICRRIQEGEKEYSIRNKQLKFRIAEVVRTLNLMEELNKGSNITNVLEDSKDYDLTMFKNGMNVQQPILSGKYNLSKQNLYLYRRESFNYM